MFFLLVPFVSGLISELHRFFVLDFIVLISWVAFSLCYRSPYVRILFVCFDSFATLGDLAVTVSDSGICVSMMKNQDGLWGCC